MANSKQEVISFKLDSDLARELRSMENRSEFIRSAILAALGSLCPLCKGSGILHLAQQRHWASFAETHPLVECNDCNTLYPICSCCEADNEHCHDCDQ